MIRFLKNEQVDRRLWDQCISEADNGIIYGYSWYLDQVCEKWEALVNEDYSVVMPLTRGRKYLMNYLYPPFFTQQLGVFSKEPLTREVCESFLSAIPVNFRYVEVNLHISNHWVPADFSTKKNSDFILPMQRPYEEIRNGYHENHLRNIRKAEKQNLSVDKQGEVKKIIEMFRGNRGGMIPGLETRHYNLFEKLASEAMRRNMGRAWIVSDASSTPLAGVVFFESHRSSIFIFSAITRKGRECSAMHFLIDHYIREFCREFQALDFEGSNNPELARFYRGFGSAEFVYLQIKRNQLPPPWSWFKN